MSILQFIKDVLRLLFKEKSTVSDGKSKDKTKEKPKMRHDLPSVIEPFPRDKTYEDFRKALGIRESGGNYAAVNSLGYMGKYQFGTARLTDLGLCRRVPGTRGYSNKSFEFIPPFSKRVFLKNKELQDACFDKHVELLTKLIQRKVSKHLGKQINSTLLTLSGAVACCHLLGFGGLQDFIKGVIKEDAYETKSTEYIELFEGYEIPTEWPEVNLRSLV
jgi:hypothetical protein